MIVGMGDREALLQAILNDPADDNSRLIYADFIEEEGESERAEFIRLQIELARLEGLLFADCDACALWPDTDGHEHEDDCPHSQKHPRRQRERVLLSGPAGRFDIDTTRIWPIQVSRGFISHITLSWADFQQHAPALIWWGPKACDCGGLEKMHRPSECRKCLGTGELPGSTDACPKKNCAVGQLRRQFGYDLCSGCSGSGRVPRPMPASAQPITTVTLTTWPEGETEFGVGTPEIYRESAIASLHSCWQSVETWHLPTATNLAGAAIAAGDLVYRGRDGRVYPMESVR